MAPKRDLSAKDAPPGKKLTRKSITLEQKMDVLRRYDRGELTAAIHNSLNLPESTLRTIRKDKENITAAFKAGAGSASARVSSCQSTFMVLRQYQEDVHGVLPPPEGEGDGPHTQFCCQHELVLQFQGLLCLS